MPKLPLKFRVTCSQSFNYLLNEIMSAISQLTLLPAAVNGAPLLICFKPDTQHRSQGRHNIDKL